MLSKHYGLDPARLGRFFAAMTKLYKTYWGGNDKNRLEAAYMAVTVLEGLGGKITVPYPDSRVLEVYDYQMFKKTGCFVTTHWVSTKGVTDLIADGGRSMQEASDCVRPALLALPARIHNMYGYGHAAVSPRKFLIELSQVGHLPSSLRHYIT